MKKPKPIWPPDITVPLRRQNQIDAAARKLAQLCLMEDIDLTYVDADGLLVRVDLPKQGKKRKRSR